MPCWLAGCVSLFFLKEMMKTSQKSRDYTQNTTTKLFVRVTRTHMDNTLHPPTTISGITPPRPTPFYFFYYYYHYYYFSRSLPRSLAPSNQHSTALFREGKKKIKKQKPKPKPKPNQTKPEQNCFLAGPEIRSLASSWRSFLFYFFIYLSMYFFFLGLSMRKTVSTVCERNHIFIFGRKCSVLLIQNRIWNRKQEIENSEHE